MGQVKYKKNIVISNKYIMSCLALPYGKCVKASTNYYKESEDPLTFLQNKNEG